MCKIKEVIVPVPSGCARTLAVLTSQILTHPSMEAVTAQEDDPDGKWHDVAEAPAQARSLAVKKEGYIIDTYDAVQGWIRVAHCPSPTLSLPRFLQLK